VDKPAIGFIALKSLIKGPPDPGTALAEIRKIYFNTTRQTIDNDLSHAIELLKSLPTEEAREKATVFMQGLSDTDIRRVNGTAEISAKVKDNLALAFGFTERYDSAPLPGKEELDTISTVSIVYTLL